MVQKQDDLTPDHLSWLIQRRHENQLRNLQLFGMFDLYKQKLILKEFSLATQSLVAVGFSLWRAVFLADKNFDIGASLADAEVFLGKVLVDNAITYPQDRNARDWTFNYYIGNAKMRLEDLEREWKQNLFADKRLADEPKDRWDISQNAYTKAVNHLDGLLRR